MPRRPLGNKATGIGLKQRVDRVDRNGTAISDGKDGLMTEKKPPPSDGSGLMKLVWDRHELVPRDQMILPRSDL